MPLPRPLTTLRAFRRRRRGLALAVGLLACGVSPAAALPGTVADRLPPAAPAWTATERAAVERAWRALPAGEVETGLRRADGSPRFVNRLLLASSPYLRLHAFNPVDWRPWGAAAFAEAQRLGRPVFLSIGYATCHWCHVMARESFEDEAIAGALNARYVAIKVDREELPDVDATYLAALAALGADGGWPANLWLTPDREPFFGGTYFAPRDGMRGAQTGLLELLGLLADGYAADPAKASASAALVRAVLAATPAGGGPVALDPGRIASAAVAEALARYDPAHGGQRGAPKFPADLPLRLLLRSPAREARDAAVATLRALARGAVEDQAGGGFHRYAVDDAWSVPHFEKTLYDNAQLAAVLLEAFQATGDPEMAAAAGRTLDALVADFADPGGGFASASDADSAPTPGAPREEGRFFTWTAAELDAARAGLPRPWRLGLGPPLVGTDRAALRVVAPPADARERLALDAERDRLRAARAPRPRPPLDRKIVTAWNGLAIGALAQGAWGLARPGDAARAARAADVLLAPFRATGRLRRSTHDGIPGPPAVLDDYAALASGLLDLYEATGATRWFTAAREVVAAMERHFAEPGGAYFFTADDDPPALVRRIQWADGVEPAGLSLAALDLFRLAAFTGDDGLRRRADRLLAAAAARLAAEPREHGTLLLALAWQNPVPEIAIVVPGDRADAEPFLAELRRHLLPARVLAVVRAEDVAATARVVPLVADKVARGGRATAYVCRGLVCDRPTTDPAVFAELLRTPSAAPAHP